MYNKKNLNSKNYNIDNNSIFKQVNTNIVTDYQRNMYFTELMQNQNYTTFCKNNINHNNNNKNYINGTLDQDENYNYFQSKKYKFNNKTNYNNNTTKTTKNKQVLNRYNSYGRMNTNLNNNTINAHTKKQISNNKKNNNNGYKYNKMQSNNNSRGHNNPQLYNQKTPLSNKKKNIIPLGNNKYKTIEDNNNFSNFGNKIYDNNINKTYIQNHVHNTIDINNLYSNKGNNITKKYNMKMNQNNYNNNNYKYNYFTNKPTHQKNNYNFKNIEISSTKRNSSKSRPKTPDYNKKGKSSSRFNLNNQRAKTPDRQRNKMKLNLNKDYLYTAENKSNKKIRHSNYSNYTNRDYNNTIDNASNNGKYQYKNQFKRLNTNDYFKLHKKTINNYDYRDTINANKSTLTSNNNTRKYSYGKLNNNSNQQNKKTKKLTKNCSQGNILGHNNYNINLNSNGINYVHKNINENNNNTNTHLHSNTNLVTPIKYVNQKSNFKGEEVQMTQIRPPNYYNIYEETFQSFGRNIPTTINHDYKWKNYEQNKIKTERNNNYYNNNKMDNLQEIKTKINKNNYEEYKRASLKNINNNYNNDKQKLNYELIREKNGNSNYKTYVPATINNIGNKTYSYFNMKKDNNIINQKENINTNNNDNKDNNEINDIDFNDLDQFSPPYSKGQVDLINNDNSKNNKNNSNIYTNIGSLQEQNNSYNNYDLEYNKKYNYRNPLFLNENNDKNNRRVIDDFINQLKTKY